MSNASLDNAKHHYKLSDIEVDDDQWNSRIGKLDTIVNTYEWYNIDFNDICPAQLTSAYKKRSIQLSRKQLIEQLYDFYISHKSFYEGQYLLQFILLSKFDIHIVEGTYVWKFNYDDLKTIYDVLNRSVFESKLPALTMIIHKQIDDLCELSYEHNEFTLALNAKKFNDMTFIQVAKTVANKMFRYYQRHNDHFRHIYDLVQLIQH